MGICNEKEKIIHAQNEYADVEKPELKIRFPGSGDIVSDAIEITIEASDDNSIRFVEYKIDSGEWNQMLYVRNNLYQSTLDTSGYKDGVHNITIRAHDFADNYDVKTLRFEIQNNVEKSTSQGDELPGFDSLISILAIAILIIIGSVFFNTRRK